MADSGAQGRATKGHQVTAAPFVSHVSVQQALDTSDPAQLQAGAPVPPSLYLQRPVHSCPHSYIHTALGQIDHRAAALVAKPAPRAQPDLLLDYLKHDPACQGVFAAWDLANKVRSCRSSRSRLLSLTTPTPHPPDQQLAPRNLRPVVPRFPRPPRLDRPLHTLARTSQDPPLAKVLALL